MSLSDIPADLYSGIHIDHNSQWSSHYALVIKCFKFASARPDTGSTASFCPCIYLFYACPFCRAFLLSL